MEDWAAGLEPAAQLALSYSQAMSTYQRCRIRLS